MPKTDLFQDSPQPPSPSSLPGASPAASPAPKGTTQDQPGGVRKGRFGQDSTKGIVAKIVLLGLVDALAVYVLRTRLAETESFTKLPADRARSSMIDLWRNHPREFLIVAAISGGSAYFPCVFGC